MVSKHDRSALIRAPVCVFSFFYHFISHYQWEIFRLPSPSCSYLHRLAILGRFPTHTNTSIFMKKRRVRKERRRNGLVRAFWGFRTIPKTLIACTRIKFEYLTVTVT